MKATAKTAMQHNMQAVIDTVLHATQRGMQKTPAAPPGDITHANVESARAHPSEGAQKGSSVHVSKAPDRDIGDTGESCKLMQ